MVFNRIKRMVQLDVDITASVGNSVLLKNSIADEDAKMKKS